MPEFAIGVPIVLLALLAFCLFKKSVAPIVALLAAEFSMIYIAPVYYIFNQLPARSENPFHGAPYIDFLQAKSGVDRVFGRDGVLMPNWASAFSLFDVRDLDAVYEGRYFPFLNTFFPGEMKAVYPDLFSCFRGLGDYNFSKPLQRRLLQLSSVRYLLSVRPYDTANEVVEEILAQNAGRLLPGKEPLITRTAFNLSGDFRETLGEHPPYHQLPYRLQVPAGKTVFHYSYGINPEVFNKPGDGVGFTLELRNAAGRIFPIFHNYIDPKHNPQERFWMNGTIDLSAFQNQRIELLFSTDPGPHGNSAFDWAGWGNLYFEGVTQTALPGFKSVFGGEAKVFEYDDVLPRAAVFYHADLVDDGPAILAKLADPSLDVFRSVVLARSDLDKVTLSAIGDLNQAAPRKDDAARIASYRSQAVQIETRSDTSGILMLNDSADPGWTVSVDDHPARWFPADYMFRCVLLTAGAHTVQFRYQPKSFRQGAAISGATLSLLAIAGFLFRLRPLKVPFSSV